MANNHIRLRAGAALLDKGRILLVPHRNSQDQNVKWYLPGGGVEFGEELKETVIREVREETGLEIEIHALLDVSECVLPEEPWHSVTLTYIANIVGGQLAVENHPDLGELAPEWFSFDELPDVVYYLRETVDKVRRLLMPLHQG